MGFPLLFGQSRERKTEKENKTKQSDSKTKKLILSSSIISKFGAELFVFKEVYVRSSQSVLPNLNT